MIGLEEKLGLESYIEKREVENLVVVFTGWVSYFRDVFAFHMIGCVKRRKSANAKKRSYPYKSEFDTEFGLRVKSRNGASGEVEAVTCRFLNVGAVKTSAGKVASAVSPSFPLDVINTSVLDFSIRFPTTSNSCGRCLAKISCSMLRPAQGAPSHLCRRNRSETVSACLQDTQNLLKGLILVWFSFRGAAELPGWPRHSCYRDDSRRG
eukprot:IDg2790t1